MVVYAQYANTAAVRTMILKTVCIGVPNKNTILVGGQRCDTTILGNRPWYPYSLCWTDQPLEGYKSYKVYGLGNNRAYISVANSTASCNSARWCFIKRLVNTLRLVIRCVLQG